MSAQRIANSVRVLKLIARLSEKSLQPLPYQLLRYGTESGRLASANFDCERGLVKALFRFVLLLNFMRESGLWPEPKKMPAT